MRKNHRQTEHAIQDHIDLVRTVMEWYFSKAGLATSSRRAYRAGALQLIRRYKKDPRRISAREVAVFLNEVKEPNKRRKIRSVQVLYQVLYWQGRIRMSKELKSALRLHGKRTNFRPIFEFSFELIRDVFDELVKKRRVGAKIAILYRSFLVDLAYRHYEKPIALLDTHDIASYLTELRDDASHGDADICSLASEGIQTFYNQLVVRRHIDRAPLVTTFF